MLIMVPGTLCRLDEYQCLKHQTNELLRQTQHKVTDPDYFLFETHIMFDDAMTWGEDNEQTVNHFVESFTEIIQEVAVEVYSYNCKSF